MRVVMEPLLGDMPLVGALSIFFLKKPVSTLTFDLILRVMGCTVPAEYQVWNDSEPVLRRLLS